MTSKKSVSRLLGRLREGDQAAAQQIWERYFRRLIGLARKKFQGMPRRVADEEDIALSALNSFFHGAEQGRFPELEDRDNLWRLLVVITARKVYQLRLHQGRRKRGANAVQGESALIASLESDSKERAIDQVLGREPTPEFAAQMADECRHLLASLPDSDLRSVAEWKLEGFTNEEIAAKLGCACRSVERKLRVIRSLWRHEKPAP
jgi:DNA-directed RNA polymerase specialized sigma24 family protein